MLIVVGSLAASQGPTHRAEFNYRNQKESPNPSSEILSPKRRPEAVERHCPSVKATQRGRTRYVPRQPRLAVLCELCNGFFVVELPVRVSGRVLDGRCAGGPWRVSAGEERQAKIDRIADQPASGGLARSLTDPCEIFILPRRSFSQRSRSRPLARLDSRFQQAVHRGSDLSSRRNPSPAAVMMPGARQLISHS